MYIIISIVINMNAFNIRLQGKQQSMCHALPTPSELFLAKIMLMKENVPLETPSAESKAITATI